MHHTGTASSALEKISCQWNTGDWIFKYQIYKIADKKGFTMLPQNEVKIHY